MTKKRFYAVVSGRKPGVYEMWEGEEGARLQVEGFAGAQHKGFRSQAEAEAWLGEARGREARSEMPAPHTGPRQDVVSNRTTKLASGKRSIHVYTDGACIGNPGPGGYGVIITEGTDRKELSGGYRLTTNNRMELMACVVGLEATKAVPHVRLFSDSHYVVRAMKEGWALRWRANKWHRNRTQRAENADLWSRLLELCDGRDVEFVWVRGHSGHPLNERCDELAIGAAKGRALPPDVGYEAGLGSGPEQLGFA